MNESRKAFESWVASTTNSDLHRGVMLDRREGGSYSHLATENKWVAWQASRAAIEIELPENKWHPCDCIDVVIAFDKDDVIESIRAAGIKVKG